MTKKVLVVDDEEDIRDILVMILESNFEFDIVEASSGNQAIEMLKSDPEIGIILCDYRMSDGNGGDVYSYLKEAGFPIPYVMVSTDSPSDYPEFSNFVKDNPLNDNINKPFEEGKIVEILKTSFVAPSASTSDVKKKSEDDAVDYIPKTSDSFVKVNLVRFLRTNRKPISVYIKLNDNKLVKILDGKDAYDTMPLIKYMNKGLQYVHLNYEEYRTFVGTILDLLFTKLSDDNQPVDAKLKLQLTSIEQIHECIHNLGVDEKTVKLVHRVIDSTVEVVKKYQDIYDILKIVNKDKNYIFEHSQLTSYIGGAILRKMDWSTEKALEKMGFAALFQNISLVDPLKAQIQDLNSPEFHDLTQKEQEKVKNHMFDSVEILEKMPDFPEDSRSAIINHHEHSGSKGFPRGLSSQRLTPFECVFILSQKFAHEIILRGVEEDTIKEIVHQFAESFDEGNFKKPLKYFLEIFDKTYQDPEAK